MKYFLHILFLAIFLPACGLFGSGSNDVNVVDEFAPTADVIDFGTASSTTTYRSIVFSNNTATTLTITNVEFSNNLCGSFGLYNIVSSTGSVLLHGNEQISASVAAGDSVRLNVAFTSLSCGYANYQTEMHVYYTDGVTTQENTVTLLPAVGTATSTEIFACDEIEDFSADYTATTYSGVPPAGEYYLKVVGLRGYMYIGPSTSLNKALGTDIGEVDPEDFISPFLQITTTETTTSLDAISDENYFCLPTAENDSSFLGQSLLLTSSVPTQGVIDDDQLSVENVRLRLETVNVPDGASQPVADDSGSFQASMVATLTMGTIPTDGSLDDVFDFMINDSTAYSDNELLLPVEQDSDGHYYLEGSKLRNGEATLVGYATFSNSDDSFLGSTTAFDFLFDPEIKSYLFVMIDVQLMTKNQ